MNHEVLALNSMGSRDEGEQSHFHVAVIGSRGWKDEELVDRFLDRLAARYGCFTLVTGGATGADTLARLYAEAFRHPVREIKPDYAKHGKGATFIRNKQIIGESDLCVAFWDGVSKGTRFTMGFGVEANIPVWYVLPTGEYSQWYGTEERK